MSERKSRRPVLIGLALIALAGSLAFYLSPTTDVTASQALDNAKSGNKLQSLAELDGKAPATASSTCKPGKPPTAPRCCSSKPANCQCSTCA